MKISQKITISFVVIIIAILLFSAFNLYKDFKIKSTLEFILKANIQEIKENDELTNFSRQQELKLVHWSNISNEQARANSKLKKEIIQLQEDIAIQFQIWLASQKNNFLNKHALPYDLDLNIVDEQELANNLFLKYSEIKNEILELLNDTSLSHPAILGLGNYHGAKLDEIQLDLYSLKNESKTEVEYLSSHILSWENNYIFIGLSITLILIIISVVILTWLYRGIYNPIRLINDAMIRLKEGNYSISIPVRKSDELGFVMQNFNEMSKQLNEALSEINLKNTELESINHNLEEAKRKAEEADKLKSVFLANISHEVRTPLNGIIGFSSLIKRKNLCPDILPYFEHILKCSDQLLKIITDILDISKIETNQLKLYHKPIDFELVFNEMSTFYHKVIKETGKSLTISFNCHMQNKNQLVMGDERRVKQILVNLINNAIKFTEQGTIEVFCGIFENNSVNFYVRDTGIGIDEEEKEKIFKIFERIYDSEDNIYEGMGLGLSIAKGIIDIIGGHISFESEKYIGTTFYIDLPLQWIANKEEDVEIPIDNSKLKGKKVLLVEDNAENKEIIFDLLQDYNLELSHAITGERAIQIIKNETLPDLVLMDLKLPGINGYETTRVIKTLAPNIPVIAQSANVFEEQIQQCYEAGCVSFIPKPINLNTLITEMEKYL